MLLNQLAKLCIVFFNSEPPYVFVVFKYAGDHQAPRKLLITGSMSEPLKTDFPVFSGFTGQSERFDHVIIELFDSFLHN